ncbi:MAG: HAD family hydrolase [Solobacterium sp.]|nr:HAD family hydrolase [Solobacterium sp.]
MYRNIRAVAADIDKTLIEKGGIPMPVTKAALEELHKRNILFGVASGRPFDRRTLEKAEEWGLSFPFDFAIGMNGGDLWDRFHEGVTHYNLLPKEDVFEICSFLKELDLNPVLYENAYDSVLALKWDWFLEDSVKRNRSHVTICDLDRLCAEDTGKIEIHFTEDKLEALNRAIAEHKTDRWICVSTFTGTLEFMNPACSKGFALRRFAEINDIPMESIMAFGDEQNDIEMLKEAGTGVCMANGSEDTKAAADIITEYPVSEDGFGRFLYKHVFD